MESYFENISELTKSFTCNRFNVYLVISSSFNINDINTGVTCQLPDQV